MVYYYTSGNVKTLRNIVIDYNTTNDMSPHEYMKTYVEKCPDSVDDNKVTWIAKTFLDIQKHYQFLISIASQLSEELTDENQDYFMIIFHAVIFQIEPKDMQLLYKCLFNLSKPLLNTFTKFLGNNEVLTNISHVAQSYYDAFYITEKIIAPLFTWQPYISQMDHTYAEYSQKLESRKIKPTTIAVHPNVLNRKTKSSVQPQTIGAPLPATPPNSLKVKTNRKMLTKSAIDQKLKTLHDKNKRKAMKLLNEVKNKNDHLTQVSSEQYQKNFSSIRDEMENEFIKLLPKPKQKFVMKNPAPVKETATTLKRINKRVLSAEQEEVQWLEDLMKSCTLAGKVKELQEYDRQEKEKDRIYDMKTKHLKGQISYEEALIAKKKVKEDNKRKYEEFLKERESWNAEIELWKKSESIKIQKRIEELSLLEFNLAQAKNGVTIKNKEVVTQLKKETEIMMQQAMKQKQEELEKRINMIKEIKVLALIAKKAKVPRIIDFTETSGLGFLSEMSMAELQERMSMMKISLKEQLEQKKKYIYEQNMAAKRDIEQTKNSIKTFMAERASFKKPNQKPNVVLNSSSSKEIEDLQKKLEEKRKLRLQLTI